MPRPVARHSQAERFERLRLALTSRKLTYADIMELLEVQQITARRMLASVGQTDPLIEETLDDGRRLFHIQASTPRPIRFTLSELVAVYLSRGALDPLAGTGLKEDLDAAAERVEAALRKHDAALAKDLSKKVFVVQQGRRKYADRMDPMDDALTALLRQRALKISYLPAPGERQSYRFDPYTLVLYRTGLYFAGHSHKHGKVITLALDHVAEIEVLAETFEYPADYHPQSLVQGAFGIFAGKPVDVHLRFDAAVARFADRTIWHASQTTELRDDGRLDLSLKVAAEKELTSWILSWGSRCEVIGPPELRARVAEEFAQAAARYTTPAP
ncbi:MAG TPA: WYL domain-containing protein [Polyangiaceae bacterium]|jgi:predicted DNA-binding transcriptional regulator YafY